MIEVHEINVHKLMTAYILAGLMGAIADWISRVPVVVWGLIALMIFDIATGLVAAYINSDLNQNDSFHGMARKAVTLILVGASAVLAHIVHLPQLHGYPEIPLGSLVAGMFCLHEFISICENTVRAGVRLPKPVEAILHRLRDASRD